MKPLLTYSLKTKKQLQFLKQNKAVQKRRLDAIKKKKSENLLPLLGLFPCLITSKSKLGF